MYPHKQNTQQVLEIIFAGTLSIMKNTPEKPIGRGGLGRGQGRSRIAAPEESTEYKLRMSTAQREKLHHLGGAGWVRDQIDVAPLPDKKED